MKTIGIIAEFNPFHNGHAYLIKKAKEFTEADRVIVIMSGNFVQRGCPAIINKYDRTLHALENVTVFLNYPLYFLLLVLKLSLKRVYIFSII